jgi:Poxvirus Late Transcription Factor VLTF3 like
MATLESRYADKVAGFAVTRARLQEALQAPDLDEAGRAALRSELAAVDAEEVEYMLQAAPYIREYTSDKPTDDAKRKGGVMDHFMQVTSTRDCNAVLQKYLMDVEKDISADVDPRAEPDELVCSHCDASMVVDCRQSMLVCPSCASVLPYLGNTEANLSYQEEISQNVVSAFSYKRLNHFSEWLNSIQARATTEIGQDVIDAIRAEFKKNRTSQRKDITPAKVRAYMKKLNYNKLYEHSHYICTLINGVPAPTLEPELEARLKHMFVSIQAPFQRAIQGTTRKNFLSYSYCLFKMCELLGRDDLLCHFSLLKSAEKLHAQDKIWKAITAELQWEFIPSV